jgi:hypothetical protein
MTKTLFTYNPTLMSPRTKKYFEAMILEGNSFNYSRWLEQVREEEAGAKSAATVISGEGAAEKTRPVSAPDGQDHQPKPSLPLITKTTRVPRALCLPCRQANNQTPKARLRRWLEKVRRAWEEFQSSRTRDAVYGYLEAVFAIVAHFRVRRRTKRLLRHAFEFARLPLDKRADPFAAVIRCTSGRDIESKTISKWSRALRYVARSKEPDIELSTFMKEAGGVNACADRYAGLMRHC